MVCGDGPEGQVPQEPSALSLCFRLSHHAILEITTISVKLRISIGPTFDGRFFRFVGRSAPSQPHRWSRS